MRRSLRYAAMALVVTFVASCSLFDYSSLAGKKYALVYGVTNYVNPLEYSWTSYDSPNLEYPAIDATSMVSVLTAAGYTIVASRWVTSSSHVIYNGSDVGAIGYNTGSSTYSTGAGDAYAPTKANIEADIQSLVGVLGKNDTIVVYFSGHGTQDTSVSPNREYFDPLGSVQYYSTASPPGYYADVAVAVRDDELGSYFASLPTNRRILILDTCYSGGFIGNSVEVDAASQTVITYDSSGNPISYQTVTVSAVDVLAKAIANYASYATSASGLSPYNAHVIAAAGKDESSYETSSLGHGVMTYALLQAAGKADLNGDGVITLGEAYSYVKAWIDAYWNVSGGSIDNFEPRISGGPVDFVLF